MTTRTIEVEPAGTVGSERNLPRRIVQPGFTPLPEYPNAPISEPGDWTPTQGGFLAYSRNAADAGDVQLPKNFRETFDRLVTQWRNETGMASSISKKVKDPNYQAIMEMGFPVVRLILRDLQKGPDHWFVALRTITGQDPIPVKLGVTQQTVTFQEAVDAWIDWGKRRGLIEG